MRVVALFVCGLALVASTCPGNLMPIAGAPFGNPITCVDDTECPSGITCTAGICCPADTKCPSSLDCSACAAKGCAFNTLTRTCGLACPGGNLADCAYAAGECPLTQDFLEGNCELRCGTDGWDQSTQRRLQEMDARQAQERTADEADASTRQFGFGGNPYGNPYGGSPYGNPWGPPLPPPQGPPQGPTCWDLRGGECKCSCDTECVADKNCCFDYAKRCTGF